ncbi:MAG: hypothetical protein KY459_06800 [Acidobacteria bacterium]|nr:hypothetical protein [Acidobacteriota bacterium]
MRLAAIILTAVLLLAGCAVLVTEWHVFSQIVDEPAHIAAGMELLAAGKYTYDLQHPPLARVLFALGPWLEGVPYVEQGWLVEQGNLILYHEDMYRRHLVMARAGNLPFFLLGAIVVALWSWRLYGWWAAPLGTFLFVSLPPVLGHAGVATTDTAAAAMLAAGLLTFDWWLEHPSLGRSIALGVALAGAVLAKLSAVAFLPGALLFVFILRRLSRHGTARAPQWTIRILAGLVAGVLLVWAVFGFSFGVILPADKHQTYDSALPEGPIRTTVHAVGENIPVPAPELFRGVLEILVHNRTGHFAYLLGETSWQGWWYYFPVAIGVKTPIPFLLLSLAGLLLLTIEARRGRWERLAPAAAAIAILGVAMTSGINIGVRHVLPIYPLLAITAVLPVAQLKEYCGATRRSWGAVASALIALLLGWQTWNVARAHPDHLAWFNEIANDHPERWLLDSNLDWGQDLFRLEQVANERGMETLSLSYFGSAVLPWHDLPSLTTLHDHPTTGWVAVSIMNRLGPGFGRGEPAFEWLDAYEPERIGKSILLYHVPEPPPAPEAATILLPVLIGPEPLRTENRAWRTVAVASWRGDDVLRIEIGGNPVAISPGVTRPEELARNALTGLLIVMPEPDAPELSFDLFVRDENTGEMIRLPVIRGEDAATGSFEITGLTPEPRDRTLRIYDLARHPGGTATVRITEGEQVLFEDQLPLSQVDPAGPHFADLDLQTAGIRTAEYVRITVTPQAEMKLWAFVLETDPSTGAVTIREPGP